MDPHSFLTAPARGSSPFILSQVTAFTYTSFQWQPLCIFITRGFAGFSGSLGVKMGLFIGACPLGSYKIFQPVEKARSRAAYSVL